MLQEIKEMIKNIDANEKIVFRSNHASNYANLKGVLPDEVKQNPTVTNVNKGLKILKSENCDFVITIGGGSPQDCGKAI
ncbi:iron-containing alcohol dehydrogenase, partial [Clostridioides difficile]